MLPSAILGLGLLIAALLLMPWYANANPAAVKRAIKWLAIIVLGVIAVFLALTGRLAAAFGVVMGIAAFGWRLMNFLAMFQQVRGLFGGLGGFGSGSSTASGKSSEVETSILRMTLDHDSGRMDGDVLTGTFAGRRLSAMTLEDLLKLRSQIANDAESAALLEAYLERAHVGWRDAPGAGDAAGAETASPHATGPMTRDEAYRVLGVEPGADAKAIKAAYRSLMSKVHPDKGGSPYLAAKINEAKDLLLKS
jgi:hypothetical protein